VKTRLLILFWLFSCLLPVAARPRVAVLPFRNPPGLDAKSPLGQSLADLVIKRLMDSGKVLVMQRSDLERLKDELNLAGDEFFNPRTFVKKGGFLGTDFVISGKILDYGNYEKNTGLGALSGLAGGFKQNKAVAYARLLIEVADLKHGRIVFSQECEEKTTEKGTMILGGDLNTKVGAGLTLGSLEHDESRMLGLAMQKALNKLIPRLLQLFVLEARIIGVSPEGVVIDMGLASGIRQGGSGKIFSLKEIRNQAGELVWSSKREIGKTKVLEAQADSALCAAPGTEPVKEGDIILFDSP
jgi:curli biogenesis system outer membrane secretion channel CsgG